MNHRDVTVVIPAAGPVDERLVALSSRVSGAMIPVDGKPVIYHTLSYLHAEGYRHVVIAVREPDSHLERFVRRIFRSRFDQLDFVVPLSDRGVGGSVLATRDHVQTAAAIVVLGDTIFRMPDGALRFDEALVLTSPVAESFRWCLVHTAPDGRVTDFEEHPEQFEGARDALIGVYYLPDARDFFESLSLAALQFSGRIEISDGLRGYMQRHPVYARPAQAWFDCGHVDTLSETRRRLLESRAFNRLTIDDVDGTLTKRSSRAEDFADEISYYSQVPTSLRALFPRVIESGTDGDAFLQLEYYGLPSLAELWLFEDINPQVWNRILRHLRRVHDRFRAHPYPVRPGDYRAMYVEKTRIRLEALRVQDPSWSPLIEGGRPLRVNGVECAPLPFLLGRLDEIATALYRESDNTAIHGDLGFSNILYDVANRVCRLIDPRGSFGRAGIGGDSKYDVAKLYHSVVGGYDFFANELFELCWKDDDVRIDLFADPELLETVGHSFRRQFFELYDEREIRTITGLLFLSMCALHTESLRRQRAMFATGVRLLSEALGS